MTDDPKWRMISDLRQTWFNFFSRWVESSSTIHWQMHQIFHKFKLFFQVSIQVRKTSSRKKTTLGLQLLDSLNYLKTNLHYYEPLTRLIEAIINRENNAERVLVIDHLKTLQVTGFPLGLYKWWESWLKQKQINFLDLLFAESTFYSFEKTQGKLCELQTLLNGVKLTLFMEGSVRHVSFPQRKT